MSRYRCSADRARARQRAAPSRESIEDGVRRWWSMSGGDWSPPQAHAPLSVTVGGDDPHSQLCLTQNALPFGRRG